MPSPRSSPAIRPVSPRSPVFKPSAHFDGLQPPSPRQVYSRPGTTPRRAPNASLKLPSLPRFHPANYPSAHSSAQVTPDGAASAPQSPLSPRTHQRVYSDAQKHLFHHQREMISAAATAAARAASPGRTGKPISPRLVPLGSPGPVTPLELEAAEQGYLAAGARAAGKESQAADELVERLIREEMRRQRSSHEPARPAGR